MLGSASSDADSALLAANIEQLSEKSFSLAEFCFQSMQYIGYIPDGDIIFSECRESAYGAGSDSDLRPQRIVTTTTLKFEVLYVLIHGLFSRIIKVFIKIR